MPIKTLLRQDQARWEFLGLRGCPIHLLAAKDRIGMLSILEGKTDQEKYVLTGKMTMIGKSSMASIKLKGFFAPTTAALISKRDNKYFIAPSESRAKAEDQR